MSPRLEGTFKSCLPDHSKALEFRGHTAILQGFLLFLRYPPAANWAGLEETQRGGQYEPVFMDQSALPGVSPDAVRK